MTTSKRASFFGILAITFLVFTASQLNAQRLELTPFVGYETGAVLHAYEGDLRVSDGMNYGGAVDVNLGGGRYVELSYSHLSSQLDLEAGIDSRYLCDLAVDYYSIGALQEMMPGAKATPYGMFTTGWVNYRPTSGGYNSENKMHLSLAGGIKIRATERIGIRLQARLLMPLFYAGTYFTVGSGGAGYGMTGGIYAVQGDFTGALFFSF
jgi:hypothetical protein